MSRYPYELSSGAAANCRLIPNPIFEPTVACDPRARVSSDGLYGVLLEESRQTHYYVVRLHLVTQPYSYCTMAFTLNEAPLPETAVKRAPLYIRTSD